MNLQMMEFMVTESTDYDYQHLNKIIIMKMPLEVIELFFFMQDFRDVIYLYSTQVAMVTPRHITKGKAYANMRLPVQETCFWSIELSHHLSAQKRQILIEGSQHNSEILYFVRFLIFGMPKVIFTFHSHFCDLQEYYEFVNYYIQSSKFVKNIVM